MARRPSAPSRRSGRSTPDRSIPPPAGGTAPRARTQAGRDTGPATAGPQAGEPSSAARPDLLVDFQIENGLLLVSLRNIGAASAYKVTTAFDHRFHGAGGRNDITSLAMFRSLPFLAPGRELRAVVDGAHAYFQRDEPRQLTATIAYHDREGRRFKDVVPHDLEVYRQLADVLPR